MTHLPATSPVAIGEVVAGKYRVESVLGTGAMGLVVGAWHIALEHSVAIKLLLHHRYGTREESIARFLTEARAAARIDSDHVARVHDVGTLADGTPFMVMDHLAGSSLETELERRGPLPITDAVDFVLQAADAIAAAGNLGIVHRDLKPANLFLATRADGVRQVKVLDFGISKSTRDSQPREDGSFGTPAYMSPEQIADPASVDTRTDVWALGAILYELVTGQMAFVGPSVKAVLDLVRTTDPTPMNLLRRGVPPELEAIVMRCLARDREHRWRDANELACALAPLATGGSLSFVPAAGLSSMEPMVASVSNVEAFGRESLLTQPDPDEVGEPIAVTIRKRKTRDAILLAVGVAVLSTAIGLVAWQFASEKRARATAVASTPPPPSDPVVVPVAEPTPAPPPVVSVQIATNPVQSATTTPPPPRRHRQPKPAPKR